MPFFEQLWDDDEPLHQAPEGTVAPAIGKIAPATAESRSQMLAMQKVLGRHTQLVDDEERLPTSQCACTLGTIDYSRADQGKITCRRCGRVWRLRESGGWWPYPCPGCNINPEQCRHYGKRTWKRPGEDKPVTESLKRKR